MLASMESPMLHMLKPTSPTIKMGDKFESCRFDFRIDTKSGLTPSRRKKAERRNCNYNTLFKCKTCGSLFESRPALLEHKVLHNEFRCIFCVDEKFSKKAGLDEHMMFIHGTFPKIAPKPIEMSPPHDDDEIVVYPQSISPPDIIEDDDDDDDVKYTGSFSSPPAGLSMKTSSNTLKSPTHKHKTKLPSPSLPPLVSVGTSAGTSSPSLPSSSIISAAVRNVFSNIVGAPHPSSKPTPASSENTPKTSPAAKQHISPQPEPQEQLSPVAPLQISPQAAAPPPALLSPQLLSPQTPMFLPMGAFPQIRYAFPPNMMQMTPGQVPFQSPEGAPAQAPAQAPANGGLPPGYVYINVPMYINPGQGLNMPQLIPAMPMPAMQPLPQTQPSPTPQEARSSPVPIQPKPEQPKRKQGEEAPADSTTAPTSSRRKKKRPSPLNDHGLIIQDPRSLSSTDFDTTGLSVVKVEPTSPQEINSEALDFSYKQDPVRQDVNISQANTKEDNPLTSSQVVDLCNSPEKEMDFEDNKAAMLEQYRTDFALMDSDKLAYNTPDETGVSKVDADSTSQSSSTKDDRNTPKDYSCDQCEFKAANGAMLTQHKAKTHKAAVKTGLNKLLGKLWQNKMKLPESEPDEDIKPTEPEPIPAPELPKPEPEQTCSKLPSAITTLPDEPMSSFMNLEEKNMVGAESSFGMYKFETCKVCKQLFDNVNDMWEHMATHKELRKFKCNLCSFKAVCRDRLTQHKQAEHPEYLKNPWAKPTKKEQQQQSKTQAASSSVSQSHSPLACKAANCNAVFNSNAERQKHTERYHCTLQCPEEGCTQTFLTVGGLKNHQFSHLEENGSNDGATFPCPMVRCIQSFPDQASLDSHLNIEHETARNIICPICKYKCRHRSSMNWHMKSKHNLDKAKTAGGRTIYVNGKGKVVADNWLEESGEAPVPISDGTENSLTSVPSPKEIQARVEEVMQHSMPDEHQRFVYNHIDGLPTPGVISYTNEPEEITVDGEAGPLTVDKLALHDRLKEEEKDAVEEQPLDMSIKKPHDADARSEFSNNSSSLDLSLYSGEVIRTLGAVPSGPNTPYARSSCSTPVQQRECTLEIDSISSPTEDMQHFTSVLKLKYVGAQGKETKKRAPPVLSPSNKSFNCQLCSAPFDDATKMWEHRLAEHDDSIHCDTCSYSSATKEDLQNHMLSTHGKELGNFKAFICFICGKGYGTKSGLNQHMLRHSEEGPPTHPCPFPDCKSKLHSKGSLKMHVRRQHGNGATSENTRVIRCRFSGCGKTFNTTKHLKVHQMQHTGEMPMKCHLCEYACRQRNSMNWHMQSKHSLEKRVSEDGRHTYYV